MTVYSDTCGQTSDAASPESETDLVELQAKDQHENENPKEPNDAHGSEDKYQQDTERLNDLQPERVINSSTKPRPETSLYGLCPPDTKNGDHVCILFGCSVPVILRPLKSANMDEEYVIIGEAYIHGKMNGEAVADFKEEHFKKAREFLMR
ncbi:hypothetical protein N7488_000286 [Penicillium malachiteum]|nr:hypothetical protein N7488_000286 [Penicillium malachiteum]